MLTLDSHSHTNWMNDDNYDYVVSSNTSFL